MVYGPGNPVEKAVKKEAVENIVLRKQLAYISVNTLLTCNFKICPANIDFTTI